MPPSPSQSDNHLVLLVEVNRPISFDDAKQWLRQAGHEGAMRIEPLRPMGRLDKDGPASVDEWRR